MEMLGLFKQGIYLCLVSVYKLFEKFWGGGDTEISVAKGDQANQNNGMD